MRVRPDPRPPAGVAVRTFQGPGDIEAWLELRNRAFARESLGVRGWDAADFQREFLDKPWWSPERMWLAVAAEPAASHNVQVVGTVTLAERGQGSRATPVIHWLAVAPRYRRRGIARSLVDHLEARAWDLGWREVSLETHAAWAAAAAFYTALGYQPVTTAPQ